MLRVFNRRLTLAFRPRYANGHATRTQILQQLVRKIRQLPKTQSWLPKLLDEGNYLLTLSQRWRSLSSTLGLFSK
ncbi:MAG: hypothetical protein F6J98_26580 [Moorea sp. SIO4G2]|nr:hypothetical protein [Moorena sp. SIO4G2]